MIDNGQIAENLERADEIMYRLMDSYVKNDDAVMLDRMIDDCQKLKQLIIKVEVLLNEGHNTSSVKKLIYEKNRRCVK